jgi:hypothetical protein
MSNPDDIVEGHHQADVASETNHLCKDRLSTAAGAHFTNRTDGNTWYSSLKESTHDLGNLALVLIGIHTFNRID